MQLMTNGATANKIQGFSSEGKMMADIKYNTRCIAERKNVGRISSMLPTSLEKRFKIRPNGFVSKNSTGALRMASVIWSCSCSEDLRET